MKEEIRKLLDFLKQPTLGFEKEGRFKKFFTILILDIIISFIVLVIMALLESVEVIEKNIIHEGDELGLGIEIIILTIIAVPIFEEFVFRYFLVYKRYNPLRIFIRTTPKFSNEYTYKEEKNIDDKWNKILPTVFYVSALLFAFMHIFNYEINTIVIALIPLLLLIQLVDGLLFGYIRIKINFAAGCALHIIHNAIVIGIALLASDEAISFDSDDILSSLKSKSIVNQKYNMVTPDYSLYISIDYENNDVKSGEILCNEKNYFSVKKYKVEDYLLKDLYGDMKSFYSDGLLLTNPDFLKDYDQELCIDIDFTKKEYSNIHSLDTVMKYMKITLECIEVE